MSFGRRTSNAAYLGSSGDEVYRSVVTRRIGWSGRLLLPRTPAFPRLLSLVGQKFDEISLFEKAKDLESECHTFICFMPVIVVEVTELAPVPLVFWTLHLWWPFDSLPQAFQCIDRFGWSYREVVFGKPSLRSVVGRGRRDEGFPLLSGSELRPVDSRIRISSEFPRSLIPVGVLPGGLIGSPVPFILFPLDLCRSFH